jgi:hypothetical protein
MRLCFGKGSETSEHFQGVESSSLFNMGASERLDDSIDKIIRIHDNRHKERTRKRAYSQGWGALVKRHMVDRNTCFGWAH